MTVEEQMQEDLPQQPIAVLNPGLLPKDSVALTRNGRSFTKAAKSLQDFQDRRRKLLADYDQLLKTQLNPLIEELGKCHAMIDEIILEMSES
jgi:hypothetical protein